MNKTFSKFLKKHFEGNAGIFELWQIAFPMIISSAFEVLMIFIDRIFLSRIEPIQMAAMMAGGLTCFTASTFFLGIVGYSGTIVAHLYGAGRKHDCSKMTSQAILLAIASYPLILCFIPVGLTSFRWAEHAETEIRLAERYFLFTMIATNFFSILRVPFASFFSGIGKTTVVMFANGLGLVANLFLSYAFILGNFGMPRLGIDGAVISVTGASIVNLFVLCIFYFSSRNRREYAIRKSFVFDKALMWKLLRFGFPSGLEFFINLSAFTAMVSLFHSYGEIVASAVTIVFNWDMIAFVTMIGLQVAVTTLVGHNLGRGNEEGAIRAAYSGFKLNCLYTLFMLLLFMFAPSFLIDLFKPAENAGSEWLEIRRLAIPMVMLMTIYIFSDGMLLVFSGAIRGAGDTVWAMTASSILHWTAALIAFFLIRILVLPPLKAWFYFVLIFPFFGLTFWLRFKSGNWKGKHILQEEEYVQINETI